MEDTLTKTDRAKPAEPADGGDAKVKRDKRYLKRFLAILLFAAVLIGAYVPVRDAVNFKYDVYDNVVTANINSSICRRIRSTSC